MDNRLVIFMKCGYVESNSVGTLVFSFNRQEHPTLNDLLKNFAKVFSFGNENKVTADFFEDRISDLIRGSCDSEHEYLHGYGHGSKGLFEHCHFDFWNWPDQMGIENTIYIGENAGKIVFNAYMTGLENSPKEDGKFIWKRSVVKIPRSFHFY